MSRKLSYKNSLVLNKRNLRRKRKVKLNIDYTNIVTILVAVSFFIIADTVFLFLAIQSKNISSIKALVDQNTFSSVEQAKFTYSITMYGQYCLDWGIVITFMIFTLMGRHKMEYGLFYVFFWMILFLLIGLLPFLSNTANKIMYIKLGVMLVPVIVIYIVLLKHANDLKWVRRKAQRERRKSRYV